MEKQKLVIYLLLFFLISCKQSGNESSSEDISSLILDEEIEEITTDSDRKVYYRFPSPDDMLRYINREKLEYLPNILNSHENCNKYINSKSQALNLGVYISELAYVTIFKKLNQASNYLEAVNFLSDELLISPNDDSDFESRVKRNLNNTDSLTVISRDAYNDMVKYLVNTNNEQTLALISTGAYVEALHLALNQIDDFNPEDPLIKKIFEQKYALSNLYLYLNEHAGENNADILGELKTIKTKLDQVNIEKTTETEVTEEDDMLVFGGGKTKVNVTEAQFKDVKKTVSRVRTKFIKV